MKNNNNTMSVIINFVTKIATARTLVVMTLTFICQKDFNENQIEFNQRILKLSEASAVPMISVKLVSLKEFAEPKEHDVFYTVKNVGSTPAFKLRSRCDINKQKENPFNTAPFDTGVAADIFPTESAPYPSKKYVKPKVTGDTIYFHVRVDFEDMLERKYYYRATHHILYTPDFTKQGKKPKISMEWSELKPLVKK